MLRSLARCAPLAIVLLLTASGRAAADDRPSLAPTAYYTLAPAAALVAVGSVLISRQDPTDSSANKEDAGTFMVGAGAMLTVAFPFVLGGQIARRRRWDAERRWAACGPGCDVAKPRRYYAASMLAPGAVLTVAGMWFLGHNWSLMRRGETLQPRGEGDPPAPDHRYRAPYIGLAAGTAIVGTTLFAAGAVHLIARSRLQIAWQRRRGSKSGVGVQPTALIPSRAAGTYAFGLAMSGRF